MKTAAKIAACSKMAVRTAVKMVAKVALKKILATKTDANLAANLACQMATNSYRRRRSNACGRRGHGEMHG